MKNNRDAIEWNTFDLKGINHLVCQSSIPYKENDFGGIYLLHIIIEKESGRKKFERAAPLTSTMRSPPYLTLVEHE